MTLKELVAARSRIDGECRIWLGHLDKESGRPYAYPTVDGVRKGVDLHRHLAKKKFDLDPRGKVKVVTTCGNPRCININHIQIIKPFRINAVNRKGSKVKRSDVELNMQVFKSLVTLNAAKTAEQLNLEQGLVYRIEKNSAMLPYFQLCLQWHTGSSLAALRELSQTEDIEYGYQLSKRALRYIKSGNDNPIADEDEYLDLLKQCEVAGDHLIWVGEFRDGEPTYKTFGGYHKNAAQQMYLAQYGVKSERLACMCGAVHCINPLHLE